MHKSHQDITDLTRLEVALLVANTRRIVSFRLDSTAERVDSSAQMAPMNLPLPLCHRLIIEATRDTPTTLKACSMYSNLQSLHISVPMTYDTSLSYLFLLPGLRRVYLENLVYTGGDWVPNDEWLIGEAVSEVQTLQIFNTELSGGILTHMIRSCKAISHFDCVWAAHRHSNFHSWY